MDKRTFARRLLLALIAIFFSLPSSAMEELHFAVPDDITVIIDRLLYEVFQRIGYGVTMDTAETVAAKRAADGGEIDGLAVQIDGLEKELPNLIMIPEKLKTVTFEAYASRDSALVVDSWEDLRGLRVGTLLDKDYFASRISQAGGTLVRKRVPSALAEAVESGECDVFILTLSLGIDYFFPETIKKVGAVETRDSFSYLNIRHAGLVDKVAEAIRAMKKDGTFEKIWNHDIEAFKRSENILIVSSYASDDSWENRLEKGIREELSKRDDLVPYFVSLNTNRIRTDMVREKIAMGIIRPGIVLNPPAVVIALDVKAMKFVGNYYSTLFNGVPVVLCGVEDVSEDGLLRFGGNATVITGTVPALENAYRILESFPDTQTLFVVNDHTEAGREWRRQMMLQLESLADRLRVVHSESGSLSDLLSTIEELSPDSVVLFGHYNLDGNSFYYPQAEVQRRVRQVAKVPLFGLRGDSIGYGQIGGKYVDPYLYGKAAAVTALAILDAPASARAGGPVWSGDLDSWIFDERELTRWGLAGTVHLPPDAQIINKKYSFYEEHPILFLMLCALFLFTLAIIGILSVVAHILRKKNRKLLEVQKTLHTAEELLSRDREIRETRDRLAIALDVMSAGVWEIDLVDRTITVDQAIARMAHFEIGGGLDDFLAKIKDREIGFGDSNFYKGLTSGRVDDSENPEVLAFMRDDGALSYFKRCFRAIQGSEGKTEKVIGVLLDVTDGVRMEQDLRAARDAAEAANRSKSRFLSSISHEIRTPMNAIIGMAGLLLTGSLAPEQKKYANDIKISAASLLVIINDILDISKMDAGKFELVPVHFDFGALLGNLGNIFDFAAREKGITFRLDAGEGLPRYLFGDDVRLRQILVNIVGNGIKFTESGNVSLVVSLRGDRLCFDISDTGRGMKEEDLNRIFDSFEQLEKDKNRKVTGTGLGLFITKNLVDLMEGVIEVESEYGRGSHFHVEIPFLPGEMSEAADIGFSCRFVVAPSAGVLVVDDNEINLDVIVGMLKLHKIDCDLALSGAEALEKIQNAKYDLIFMDHMMPDMDGVETTVRIREKESGGRPSIIVALTANASEGARDELLGAGMDDYLSKPIREDRLNEILEKWLPKEKIAYGENPYVQSSGMERRYSALLSRLGAFWELDLKAGLGRVEGQVEMYRRSLEIATHRLPEAIRRLERHLEKEDMKNFAIDVHGIKSSLHIIGATGAADRARELETRAKHGDLDYCVEHAPRFLDELRRMQVRLSALLAEDGEDDGGWKKTGSPAEMKKKLAAVKAFLETFAYVDAADAVRGLLESDYGSDLNSKLKELMDHILGLEPDRAIALIEDLAA